MGKKRQAPFTYQPVEENTFGWSQGSLLSLRAWVAVTDSAAQPGVENQSNVLFKRIKTTQTYQIRQRDVDLRKKHGPPQRGF